MRHSREKMMDLVNDCVLNLNNKENIQETKCKPVDATQFEVLNDPTGNLDVLMKVRMSVRKIVR